MAGMNITVVKLFQPFCFKALNNINNFESVLFLPVHEKWLLPQESP